MCIFLHMLLYVTADSCAFRFDEVCCYLPLEDDEVVLVRGMAFVWVCLVNSVEFEIHFYQPWG